MTDPDAPSSSPWSDVNRYHWNEDGIPCATAGCSKSHWIDGHSLDRARLQVEEVERLNERLAKQEAYEREAWLIVEDLRAQLSTAQQEIAGLQNDVRIGELAFAGAKAAENLVANLYEAAKARAEKAEAALLASTARSVECDCGYKHVAEQLRAEIDTLRGARAELKAEVLASTARQGQLEQEQFCGNTDCQSCRLLRGRLAALQSSRSPQTTTPPSSISKFACGLQLDDDDYGDDQTPC